MANTSAAQAASSPANIPTPALAYDVAVIRPSNTENSNSGITVNDAILLTENVSLLQLLSFAFNVRQRLISGLPPWAAHARFDISAKILDADPEQIKHMSPEQERALLSTLLEQRFGLKWHSTTQAVSDYELVIAKGGPKLTPTKQALKDDSTSINNTDMTAKGVTLASLAETLSDQVDRPVVDKTGLDGRFDIHLRWSRDDPKTEAVNDGIDPDAPPPIFTAIEEQLGLRLVSGKDPVRTLVVDQLSQPTEN